MKQTFTKDERLHRKILIGRLFKEGSAFFIYPYRITWLETPFPEKSPAQLLISVPKQYQRRAVRRNLIKRRTREAFRKNKHILYDVLEKGDIQIVFGVCYSTKEIVSYRKIEEKIIVILHRLREVYAETSG